MSEAVEKKWDPEMRGALYEDAERKNDKAPIATGSITISGVELRLAMWPSAVSQKGKKYWPVKVEYKQGTKFMLAKISPANVVVTGGTAQVEKPGDAAAPGDKPADEVGDMPF